MSKRTRKLHETFAADPIEADQVIFGRESDPVTRRGFVKGLAGMAAILGAEIVFHRFMPAGLIPAALANEAEAGTLSGKDPGLTLLNDRPVNAETPPHLLDDKITPAERMFVRNNGIPPVDVDPTVWQLSISGESVRTPKTWTIDQLRKRFSPVSLQLLIECGGNGRAEFNPPASGNQWSLGAVACPEFNGIRLADVLEDCGIKDDAVYVGYLGADTHLSGDPGKEPISRGVPLAKAMEPESLIAFGMNGAPLHPLNGHPLRLAIGGWPGSVSGKWLTDLLIRDRIHDGAKMTGTSYRVPCKPVAPGETVADEDMCIIEAMPVKSLLTAPQTGLRHPIADALPIRGHAWAGDRRVKAVDVSMDFGQTWQSTRLDKPANRNAWQHWGTELRFPQTGYYEIWARATDDQNISQPMVLPGWNPKGYLNNATHRIAVYVI